MAWERTIRSGQRLLRCGYTTGTCAALAAMGAARLLLTGQRAESLALRTPKGWVVEVLPERLDWLREGASALCAVRKDGGDDPDATTGLLICAAVERSARPGVTLLGGEGVGRVTRPGLEQPVGEAAINRVPRQMIAEALAGLCEAVGYEGGLRVTISVPGGAEVGKRTFNPLLGIEGGISILGTSGIVEPMSEQAIVDTIAVEQHQAAATGKRRLILTPGNYGLDWLAAQGMDRWGAAVVRCSNFVGDALDIAAAEGFAEVLLVGHIGKLVKLAGGIMNTHSRYADCRTELFCAHAAVCGGSRALCEALLAAPTTDACLDLLDEAGLREAVMERLLEAIRHHLARRAGGAFRVGAVVFSNQHGLLGQTREAEELLNGWNLQ